MTTGKGRIDWFDRFARRDELGRLVESAREVLDETADQPDLAAARG